MDSSIFQGEEEEQAQPIVTVTESSKKPRRFTKKNSIADYLLSQNQQQNQQQTNSRVAINLNNFNNNESNTSMTKRSFYLNDFNFEFILLKSIIYYKYDKKSIEVSIELNSRPYFLYYDVDFIDVLLLEKIIIEMNISGKIQQMCK